jgi:hypothetical protein
MNIHYTSELGPGYRADLESLLFFNPGQSRVHDAIVAMIGAHGIPSLSAEGGRLRIGLKGGRESQTLFALAGENPAAHLAGVMIYTRMDATTLLILHLAVAREFSAEGKYHGHQIALRLIATVRGLAKRIKGIRVVQLIYGGDQPRDIPV